MEDLEEVKKKVVKYIQGKHGLIGIIMPEKETTEEEWKAFYKSMAEIAIAKARRRGETK